jgi:uncharacterized protein YcaQ
MTTSLDALRRYAIGRSLFPPTTLKRAVEKLGFVQADPIRAPARAQDLTLRHRVRHYRADDLERRYAALGIEEDFFVNHGFLSARVQALMHPRGGPRPWPRSRAGHVEALLAFVRERGEVHPRVADEHFSFGTVRNYWGGSSNATTHLLTEMHYRGLLRVVRRERGIRIYAAHEHPPAPTDRAEKTSRLDALVDVAVSLYAPVPAATLSWLVNRLQYAVPQWRRELPRILERAKERLAHARVDAVDWYWPAHESPSPMDSENRVRLLAPFDPVVWDRRRFERFWGWSYRFEAYTPASKRKLGYYALPVLWRDAVIGWANLSLKARSLQAQFGYVSGAAPTDGVFRRGLDAELEGLQTFLRTKAE